MVLACYTELKLEPNLLLVCKPVKLKWTWNYNETWIKWFVFSQFYTIILQYNNITSRWSPFLSYNQSLNLDCIKSSQPPDGDSVFKITSQYDSTEVSSDFRGIFWMISGSGHRFNAVTPDYASEPVSSLSPSCRGRKHLTQQSVCPQHSFDCEHTLLLKTHINNHYCLLYFITW